MAATKQVSQVKEHAEKQANALVRFMKSSYKVTMEAGEEMSLRALDIPADILKEMGAEERAKSFKQFNRKMVGGVYRGVDNVAETFSTGFSAPIQGVSSLLEKLKKRGTDEAKKATKNAKKASKEVKKASKEVKKASKEVKKAARPAKVEKTVGKTKAKAKKASTAAKKAKGEVVTKTKAAEKKVTEKLAA